MSTYYYGIAAKTVNAEVDGVSMKVHEAVYLYKTPNTLRMSDICYKTNCYVNFPSRGNLVYFNDGNKRKVYQVHTFNNNLFSDYDNWEKVGVIVKKGRKNVIDNSPEMLAII